MQTQSVLLLYSKIDEMQSLKPVQNASLFLAIIFCIGSCTMGYIKIILSGPYYFPGMYAAILAMIPGIYSIYRLLKYHKLQSKQYISNCKKE